MTRTLFCFRDFLPVALEARDGLTRTRVALLPVADDASPITGLALEEEEEDANRE